MFDNLKNLAGLMGQAKELRAKMEELQNQLAKMEVEGEAGAGAVRVRMNGKFEVLEVTVDRPLVATLAGTGTEADAAMVGELIASAVNAAFQKAQALARDEMMRVTGLGGMGGLPGMGGTLPDAG